MILFWIDALSYVLSLEYVPPNEILFSSAVDVLVDPSFVPTYMISEDKYPPMTVLPRTFCARVKKWDSTPPGGPMYFCILSTVFDVQSTHPETTTSPLHIAISPK